MTEAKAAAYATAVVQILHDHFPSLSAQTSHLAFDAIERQARVPVTSFEFIVDDPYSARWRLRGAAEDRSRVRLHYCPVVQPGAGRWHELERTVNEALDSLAAKEAGQ